MFIGTTRNSLDEKGRLAIPAKFRSVVEAEGEEAHVWVTPGLAGNLHVYPRSAFMEMSEELNKLSAWDPDAMRLRSTFYGNAEKVKVDRSGRMTVPPHLRDLAGIDREAVLVGAQSYLELWSAERYDERGTPDLAELFSTIAKGASQQQ